MNAETFFESFDLLADAPNSVEMLRELILQLAIQGQLVGQDPTDEPAVQLIARIDKARNALEIAPAEVRVIEQPWSIPHSWEWTCLDRIGVISPRNSASDEVLAAFAPMNVIPKRFGDEAKFEERPWGEMRKGFTHIADGDIVAAKITPCFQNAKSAVMRGLKNGIGAGTTELHVVRPISGKLICPEYVLLYLKSPGFLAGGVARMSGSAGQQRVPREYFAYNPFPLPPLAEQRRIVSKVDELLGLCDELETRQGARRELRERLVQAALDQLLASRDPADFATHWQRLLCHFDFLFDTPTTIYQLRQVILQLAVQGLLVPQDPDDEPADSLIIAASRDAEKFCLEHGIRQTSAGPVAPKDEPWMNPIGWAWTRLASVCYAVTDGDHVAPPQSESGVAFLTIGNVTNGRLEFVGCRHVPDTYYASLKSFRKPRLGDLLYTVVGATYGRPILVDSDRPFCVQRHIAILKPSSCLDVRYGRMLMASPFIYDQARSNITGTAQPTLPLGPLRNFIVPLPPLSEQKRIVSKVTELLSVCDAFESQLKQVETASTRLLSAAIRDILVTEPQPVKSSKVTDIQKSKVSERQRTVVASPYLS